MEGSANCPICGKEVALENMNSHIDICLLPGGKELQAEMQTCQQIKSTSTVDTPASQAPRPQGASVMSRKRQSPKLLSGSGSGKQSLLAPFEDETPHHNLENQPPTKSRKIALSSTPKSTKQHPVNTLESAKSATSKDTTSIMGVGGLKAPLAEVMRPTVIDDFVGQENIIGKNAILRAVLESGQVPSMIFWGPPGCGKVRIIVHFLFYKSMTFSCFVCRPHWLGLFQEWLMRRWAQSSSSSQLQQQGLRMSKRLFR